MGKFKIPIITRSLDLREYAPEFGDDEMVAEFGEPIIWMWVNPPRSVRADFASIRKRMLDALAEIDLLKKPKDEKSEDEAPEPLDEKAIASLIKVSNDANEALFGWWAKMWSKGTDPETHFIADEVKELALGCGETDPQLWTFIQTKCFELMTIHQMMIKKK